MQMQTVQLRSDIRGDLGKRAAGGGLTAIRKILARLSRMAGTIAGERDRLRAIQELQRLDNHLLADIGIKRGEIEHVIRSGRGGL